MSKRNSRRRPIRKADGTRPVVVVAVTGASGAAYAVRLVECLVEAGRRVHLVITEAGRLVMADELLCLPRDAAGHARRGRSGQDLDLGRLWPARILAHVTYTPAEVLDGPPASGSFRAEATVVVPCSMNTAAALAAGLAGNLAQRAAYVTLKEGRPLVLVPREMPLTPIDLENLARLASAGATVMPAMPGFYHRPRKVEDLVDFVVAKVLQHLGLPHPLATDWPGATPQAPAGPTGK